MTHILLLGGTTEAGLLARALADAGLRTVYSYAGRTAAPVAQPVPVRVGGFGGVAGLQAYLRDQRISHVVDATHPFAAQMSRNAVAACAALGLPLIGYERSGWVAGPGDDWRAVPDIAAAVAALPDRAARVFLAIGRQHLAAFAARPQHSYLLRLVDCPESLPLPQAQVVVARGPFTTEADLALLRAQAITHIVAKNAGGTGARAKLDAARLLGLPVILIDRPALPQRQVAGSVAEVMRWLGHSADLGV
ncbi:MAG: cobalt-precorrin-6A reductase [Pseudotabrizicola sp.]|uniref:cobalt-precorrin-6A reductase n=1 Tax=Pseudotabrizicola sp. TaxID=2939647 RepID=UPI00271BA0B3|nr:cobalt-precorrin-6A reductase [Pseudotabrizicola sp.]MDO9638434.1 cobalt-precorrin-6A reductase [Pseudotabrizicola sp.]